MFDLGIQELIVIFIVALIVFGPKRLPELGRTIGKGMAELRKAMEGVRTQIHTEVDTIEKPTDTVYAEPAERKEPRETGTDAHGTGKKEQGEVKEGKTDG